MATPLTATGDNVIVINELLCFYINRMDILPRSILLRIVLDNFTDTDINQAKDVLHSHISITLKNRRIKRQGSERAKNNIDDISKVLDEIDPNHIPIFVARDLGKLPNIDFNHVDVSSLSREITMCKKKQNDTDDAFQLLTNSVSALSTQISTLVSSFTSGVPNLVNATAKSPLPLQQIITATTAAKFMPTRLAISSERQSSTSPPITPLQSAASISAESAITSLMGSPPAPQQSVETTTQPSTSTTPTAKTSSPLWTDVVSKKSLKSSTKMYVPYTSVKQHKTHQMTTGKASVKCGLKCAPARLVSAEYFLTGFHTDTSCVDISTYVSSNLKMKCTCERIPSTHKYYASFKLCVDIGRPNTLYDANLWPVGTKIGRYFPPRKHNTANSTHL